MKRTALISLICSMLAAVVLMIGILFAIIIGDGDGLERRKLVVSSASAAAIYNGETLSDNKWHLSDGELKEGHTISVNVTGSQKNVGISENYCSATILDKNGVDVTEDYDIEYRPGILNVREREICLVADSDTKMYDGEPLTAEKYTLMSAISLLPTDTIEATVEGSITEVGEELNRITSVAIKNNLGEDVTRNYHVRTVDGKLVVYSTDALVFESDDDVKKYDGTPLTNGNWTLVSGTLDKDHSVEVSVTGRQIDVGTSENTFSVRILNENAEDITGQYEVVCKPGKLTVIPAEVTVMSDSSKKQYDGRPLTDSDFTTYPSYYSTAFKFEPVIIGSQTEIGKSENIIASCRVFDKSGRDISENFVIIYDNGLLEVLAEPLSPTELLFVSMDAEKIYDGTPLTNNNWELVGGELLEEHTAMVNIKGSITDVGTASNFFTVNILDSAGNDVTEKYDIKMNFGKLVVRKQKITVTSDSAQKIYDGEPLTAEGYKVTEDSLASLYRVECQVVGSRTEVGTAKNTIAHVRIFNSTDTEITSNFDIVKKAGDLTVVAKEEEIKPELTFSSEGAEKIYDGTPLTNESCSLIEGELLPGHYVNIIATGSITNVGRTDNTYNVVIYDEEGNDVTDKYVIHKTCGTLIVKEKRITVIANSDKKIYDGTPLTNSGYKVVNSGRNDYTASVPSGHELVVNIIGSITDPGEINNTIMNVDVINQHGESVRDNFIITMINGSLKVEEEPDSGDEPTGRELFRVISDKDDRRLYLKERSMGDYDPASDSWSNAPEYNILINDSYSAYYLPSFALDNSGMTPRNIEIQAVGGIFAMPYYSSTMSSIPAMTSDSVMEGSTAGIYSVSYYDWHNTTGIKMPAKYSDYEDEYARYVEANYLYVDPETDAYMQNIIAAEGFSKDDPGVISQIAAYIRESAEYDLKYDREMDSAENPVIAFLGTYRKGVCRHYAKAATLLYRSLGIPARYTVGFVQDNVKAGQVNSITDKSGHAWVEVYVENIGWVEVEVTGSATPTKISLTVEPVDTRVEYDGAEHTAIQQVLVTKATDGVDMSKYVLEAVVSGKRSELGMSATIITNLIIKDRAGIVVYNKAAGIGLKKFDVKYETGILHVYRSYLTFASASKEKIYDGYALKGEVGDITLTGGIVYEDEGYSCVITPIGSVTDCEKAVANAYTVAIYKDGKNVTDHYYIKTTFGSLKVNAREIVITAASATGKYGETLTCNQIEYDINALAETDIISSWIVEGEISNIGKTANVVRSVTILNKENKDVSDNYQITFIDGILKITP